MNFIFDNDRPIYLQLVEQLERYIVIGELKPGDKLPSVRELASRSKVNPNTMQKALTELENMGLIYTERTNGKYVTCDEKLVKERSVKSAYEKSLKYLNDMRELGYTDASTIAYLKKIGEK